MNKFSGGELRNEERVGREKKKEGKGEEKARIKGK